MDVFPTRTKTAQTKEMTVVEIGSRRQQQLKQLPTFTMAFGNEIVDAITFTEKLVQRWTNRKRLETLALEAQMPMNRDAKWMSLDLRPRQAALKWVVWTAKMARMIDLPHF